jgi:biopolymer transport protein ExbD
MKLPRTPIRRARIEIIPMIDTIFFLLVFFMIASLTMIRMRAIAIALPKGEAPVTAAAQPTAASSDLILTMSDRGDFFLGKQRLGPDSDSLQAALTTRLTNGAPKDIVLNFNKVRTTQEMITVMDIINRTKTATGRDVPVLIATAPVDQEGRALSTDSPTPLSEGSVK